MNKLIIVFILCTVTVQAQIVEKSLEDDKQVYYWFNTTIGHNLDKSTGQDQVYVKSIGNDISSGSFIEFMNAHAENLISNSVVMGPYPERYEAQNAQFLYRGNDGSSNKKSSEDDDEPVYSYYFVKPVYEDSLQKIYFERIPSRVTSGTLTEFEAMLSEGLNFEKLAVGPFSRYELAEKSKFVFRRNGEINLDSRVDSAKIRNLEFMAKKWKSLKLDIIKKGEDKELNKYTYRFSTNFPKNYFNSDACQIFTITASYSESFSTSSTSFTLQGEDVIDNNYIVPSGSNTVYINIIYFDKFEKAKINGFLFESFIFNDYEMIRLEPMYVTVK